jgi:hypothetical protein
LIVTITIICSEYFITMHNLHFIRMFQMIFSYVLVYFFYRNEVGSLLKDLSVKFNIRSKITE